MGKQGTLTKAEMQVMNILWSLPSMKGTISDVLEGYGEKKPAYTTVATFMKILLNKGYVGFEKLKGTKTQCEGGLVRRFVVLFGSFFCQRGTYLGRRIERNA